MELETLTVVTLPNVLGDKCLESIKDQWEIDNPGHVVKCAVGFMSKSEVYLFYEKMPVTNHHRKLRAQ